MKIKPGYRLRSVAGETVALPETGINFDEMIVLNESAVFLWKRLETGATEESLLRDVSREYGMEPDRIAPGVKRFITRLREGGYLEEEVDAS